MNKYQFNLVWSNRDNEYMVTCPEFPGLSAFGETAEEALAEAQVALELFIETYQEDGVVLPEPLTVPEYSGQLRLRLPKSLHGQAAKLAADDGVSLNQFICNALQAKVSGQEVTNAFVEITKKPDFSTVLKTLYSRTKSEDSFRRSNRFNGHLTQLFFSSCTFETNKYTNADHKYRIAGTEDKPFYLSGCE